MQFTVRGVIAITASVSILFGTVAIGWVAAITFGIPAAVLALMILRRGRRADLRKRDSPAIVTVIVNCISLIPLAISVAVAVAICLHVGWPSNELTWLVMTGPVLWCFLFMRQRPLRISWLYLVIPVLGFLQVWDQVLPNRLVTRIKTSSVLPAIDSVRLFTTVWAIDVRGGRNGLCYCFFDSWNEIDISFARPGKNTELIEKYLGRVEPAWRMIRSQSLPRGGSYFHRKSLFLWFDFQEGLKVLPNEDTRKQVMVCICEPENMMRIHQGLLWVAITVYGYPKGIDAEKWWHQHGHNFRIERDAAIAVQQVQGWTYAIEQHWRADNTPLNKQHSWMHSALSVAKKQEMRSYYGRGDDAFALAIRNSNIDFDKISTVPVWLQRN